MDYDGAELVHNLCLCSFDYRLSPGLVVFEMHAFIAFLRYLGIFEVTYLD